MKNPEATKVLINSYLHCYPVTVAKLTHDQRNLITEVWESFFAQHNASDQEMADVLSTARKHLSEPACTATILALLNAHRLGAAKVNAQ